MGLVKKKYALFLSLFSFAAFSQSIDFYIEGAKQDYFRSGPVCTLALSAKNNLKSTITFMVKLNFYDSSNRLITADEYAFQNIRANLTTTVTDVMWDGICSDIKVVKFRGIRNCSVDGEYSINSCPFNLNFNTSGVFRITQ